MFCIITWFELAIENVNDSSQEESCIFILFVRTGIRTLYHNRRQNFHFTKMSSRDWRPEDGSECDGWKCLHLLNTGGQWQKDRKLQARPHWSSGFPFIALVVCVLYSGHTHLQGRTLFQKSGDLTWPYLWLWVGEGILSPQQYFGYFGGQFYLSQLWLLHYLWVRFHFRIINLALYMEIIVMRVGGTSCLGFHGA